MNGILLEFWKSSGFSQLFQCDTVLFGLHMPGELIMIAIACLFLYLAIHKGYEPYLLIPIAFGMLLVNIYPDIMKNHILLHFFPVIWYNCFNQNWGRCYYINERCYIDPVTEAAVGNDCAGI